MWTIFFSTLDICHTYCQSQSTYFTVRGQSYFSRLPKYWPPIPLSACWVCPPPATKAGGTHSPGGEGDGGSIFWKTREIGLPSYSKICTLCCQCSVSTFVEGGGGGRGVTGRKKEDSFVHIYLCISIILLVLNSAPFSWHWGPATLVKQSTQSPSLLSVCYIMWKEVEFILNNGDYRILYYERNTSRKKSWESLLLIFIL